jgi:hypothetical protein
MDEQAAQTTIIHFIFPNLFTLVGLFRLGFLSYLYITH